METENHQSPVITPPASASTVPAAPAPATVAPAELDPPPAPSAPGHPDATQPSPVNGSADGAAKTNTLPPPTPGSKRIAPETKGSPATHPEKPVQAAVAADTVRLSYSLVLHAGAKEVVTMKSQLDLPLALAVDNLAQTDIAFPELFDKIVTRPLVNQFRAFLQRRFDEASAAEADNTDETASPPEPRPRRPAVKPTAFDPSHLAAATPPKRPNSSMAGWHDGNDDL